MSEESTRPDLRSVRDGSAREGQFVALGFAAAVALLLFLAWLLLPACAALPLFGRLWPGFCPSTAVDSGNAALEAEAARREVLTEEIRRLELAILEKGDCVPTDGGQGVMPGQTAEAPSAQPEEATPPQPPAEEAPIDDEQWEEKDIGLLEGCWTLDSNYRLRDITTGDITTVDDWQVCFDDEGVGRQQFQLSNGATCDGPISGSFDAEGALRLDDQSDIECSDDTRIFQRQIVCERAGDGTATCEGRQEETDSRARIRLKR
jgi:hypothetical protein